MAELLATELEQFGEPVTLVGHSMGGKVAMQLALRRPELLRALVVVDIAPVEYPVQGGRTADPDEEASPFADYIEAMRALDLDTLRTRIDADEALKSAVPSRMVRSFLLQSLVREGLGDDGGWRWRLNLDLLGRDLEELRGFPPPPPGHPSTGRCSGSPARTPPTSCPRTARTWTPSSRAPAWCGSRTPGTGCTPNSRRPFSRRCSASWPPSRAESGRAPTMEPPELVRR